MKRKSRLTRLKPKVAKGYFMIPKNRIPPRDILRELPFKPLDVSKYKRVKNGKKKKSS